jgi:hypothetical protein
MSRRMGSRGETVDEVVAAVMADDSEQIDPFERNVVRAAWRDGYIEALQDVADFLEGQGGGVMQAGERGLRYRALRRRFRRAPARRPSPAREGEGRGGAMTAQKFEQGEIRRNDDGTLDEVVCRGFSQLERMGPREWSLDLGGVLIHFSTAADEPEPVIVEVVDRDDGRDAFGVSARDEALVEELLQSRRPTSPAGPSGPADLEANGSGGTAGAASLCARRGIPSDAAEALEHLRAVLDVARPSTARGVNVTRLARCYLEAVGR